MGSIPSEIEIQFPECVFVTLTCFFCLCPCLFFCESGVFPNIDCRNRMVRRGEGFFRTDGPNPLFNRFFVVIAKLIEVRHVHVSDLSHYLRWLENASERPEQEAR